MTSFEDLIAKKEKRKKQSAEYFKKAYAENPDRFKESAKRYAEKNKEKIKQRNKENYEKNKDFYRQRYIENKESIISKARDYVRNRRKNDINYRIKSNIRTRTWKAIKGINKSKSTMEMLGCTVDELKIHIQGMFKDGMSWDNYGEWHIDHIYPLSKIDPKLDAWAFSYKNLQPLWADENRRKYNHAG